MAAAAQAVLPAAERVFHLPAVKTSPSLAQYAKHKLREKPYYIPAFSMTKEQWNKTLARPWFRKTDPLMPLYPYGKNYHFPEANYGLYGGATLQTGNKISKGRNKGKTLRKWFPNIRVETVRSEALDKELHIPIRARVMRTIRKLGGLDNYVLGDRPARIKELGLLGWKLRWLVMTSPKMREQYAEKRKKLGLPETYSAIESFEEAWNDPDRREKMIEEQEEAWAKLKAKMDKWDAHVEAHWTTSDRKYANLKESYTYDKTSRPYTILDTTPSQINLPDKIAETPYEIFEKLPKRVREGERSERELWLLRNMAKENDLRRLDRGDTTEDALLALLEGRLEKRREEMRTRARRQAIIEARIQELYARKEQDKALEHTWQIREREMLLEEATQDEYTNIRVGRIPEDEGLDQIRQRLDSEGNVLREFREGKESFLETQLLMKMATREDRIRLQKMEVTQEELAEEIKERKRLEPKKVKILAQRKA